MATAAAVERFKAAGKQQLNIWVDSDVAALLKTLAAQRSESYGDVLRDALIALHSGQPVAPAAPAIGGDSLDRLSASVSGLNAEITQLGGAVRDFVETTDDRITDLESRLQHLEATISAGQGESLPTTAAPVEAALKPAPGGNEAPGKKQYNRAPDTEIEERRKLFLELHNTGNSTSQISHAVRAKGYKVGTSASEVDKYLRSKGLVPNRMRG